MKYRLTGMHDSGKAISWLVEAAGTRMVQDFAREQHIRVTDIALIAIRGQGAPLSVAVSKLPRARGDGSPSEPVDAAPDVSHTREDHDLAPAVDDDIRPAPQENQTGHEEEDQHTLDLGLSDTGLDDRAEQPAPDVVELPMDEEEPDDESPDELESQAEDQDAGPADDDLRGALDVEDAPQDESPASVLDDTDVTSPDEDDSDKQAQEALYYPGDDQDEDQPAVEIDWDVQNEHDASDMLDDTDSDVVVTVETDELDEDLIEVESDQIDDDQKEDVPDASTDAMDALAMAAGEAQGDDDDQEEPSGGGGSITSQAVKKHQRESKAKAGKTSEKAGKKSGKSPVKWIILVVVIAAAAAGGFFAYQHFFAV